MIIKKTTTALVAVVLTATSCTEKISDATLTEQAVVLVNDNPTASVQVEKGQAHLTGVFASEEERDKAINAIKAIEGIEDVHDMTTINDSKKMETETISAETLEKLTQSLEAFPSVTMEVINGELVLSGNVSPTQEKKIKEYVNALGVEFNNNLTVK